MTIRSRSLSGTAILFSWILFVSSWANAQAARPPEAAMKTQPAAESASSAGKDSLPSVGATANDSVLDSELAEVKRQLMREALNRMRRGGGSGPGFELVMHQIAPFFVFSVAISVFVWMLRVALDNRRWYRLLKVQTDMHAKMVDRFASSQEIIAYMESEAGKRFLESPKFDIQPSNSASFPFNRILWSVQVGLITTTLGGGLFFLRNRVPQEGEMPLLVFGTIAIMLGIGFLLSSAVSYILSKHFGLIEEHRRETSAVVHTSGADRP
jgi:hypothetical protein